MISRNYPVTFFILLCSMALSSSGCRVEGGAVENPVGFDLQRGAGAFEFSTPAGATTESIAVHYQIPLLGDIDEMPVLFVFQR